MNRLMKKALLIVSLTMLFALFALMAVAPETAWAATTELTITKLASDGTTVLSERTVTYQELKEGQLNDGTFIEIMGDGVTRYYHQGPVFKDDPDPEIQEMLRWNEEEDQNWDTKDMGALKGTNVTDLCDLVGGMEEGDVLQVKSSDGFKKTFAYKNVYEYDPEREGPMVVCWYQDGKYPDTGYNDGMRLVWFAGATYKEGPTSIEGLPPGEYHVFGNWDWHEAADPEYWYYYNGEYPTTTGLSAQKVSNLRIFSTQEPPVLPSTWYVDPSGNADFITIQAAVTAADAGDTIVVKDGTYTENIVVDKSLVIQSENGPENTVVQAAATNADVFKVTAENVTIDGFTASGATAAGKSGVAIWGAEGKTCTVKNNQCSDNSQGVTIEANAKDNTIFNNTCSSSGRYGVHLTNTAGNFIIDNTCLNNTAGSGYAIYLADNANNNTVSGNLSDSNKTGIRVKNAFNNTVYGNVFSNNEIGLELATKSTGNVFYLNNFIDNNRQLSEGFQALAGNFWSSPAEQPYEFKGAPYTGCLGNYWSDYDGEDADCNGIGDVPYGTILTDSDNYPLMGQWDDDVITAPEEEPPATDVLYDGEVTLVSGETFTVTIGTKNYEVDCDTPLGALQAAADAGGFTYVVGDKKYEEQGIFLLDDIGDYPYVKKGSQWSAYVNGVYKDGFEDADDALNIIKLSDGDEVEYYYAAGVDKNDYDAVKAAATAAVKTVAVIDLGYDVLYDGTVSLLPGETFTVTVSGNTIDVDCDTPLGALQAAATAEGFTFKVGDKKYAEHGVLLLDDIGDYPYVGGGSQWSAFVNGVFKDGFEGAQYALNLIKLNTGDRVEFYYVAGVDKTDYNAVKAACTAAVKTVVDTGGPPVNWTLSLKGARDEAVTKDYFEQGLLCRSSHSVTWTDDNSDVWGGVPLWLLVGMVDDNPDTGSAHFNFNDELAALGYSIKITGGDGWNTTLESAAIAHDDGYIVANTLNGEPLPYKTEAGKGCWPLHLKGAKIHSGQQVGNIVRIELIGIPELPAGWTLEMLGEIGDTITQQEFEDGLACTGSGHYAEWTDKDGNVWSGVPLWVLLGVIDDIEAAGHWTFNDSVAANGYTVKVIAGDGDYSKTFNSTDVKRSNDYIIANKINGEPLEGSSAPLCLVGNGVVKTDGSFGGSAVGNIAKIEIPELQTPPAAEGSWNLTLKGRISDVYSQAEFEAAAACHGKQWTDGEGNLWSGIPLWLLTGWVDDRQPHAYDFTQAMAGYTVLVKAGDGYGKDFDSKDLAKNDNYIIANKCNGEPLMGKSFPLRLVGAGVATAEGALGGFSVGGIAEIELIDFGTPTAPPELHIVKYAEDGVTVLAERTVSYLWMENESGFDVIGNGTTVYKFEGITNDPDDVWSDGVTYPGGFKIEDAIKGTRVRDLCELVGGMGAATDIIFVAKDGWETVLPYSSIYPDPAVQARQGDAVLAWFANGKYVPDYKDGMRLFFTPEDHVYSQWDMHESLPEQYWHFYYGGGVKYPSCAGLSAKYITEIKIYSVPHSDWTLALDGRDIGGTHFEVSKTYFEQALTCTFGANHKASYTDSNGNIWEGMPLWFFAGYVDDEDEHSSNAFNEGLALAGYEIVITSADGHSVSIDSKDIIRNSDYIIANTLNGALIPDDDSSWPLRLVGPSATGSDSLKGIARIELRSVDQGPAYTVTPEADDAYTVGTTAGISTMTVNSGVSGMKYFTANITPVVPHDGNETAVFTHLRNGAQLTISAIRADFDQDGVNSAQAGFNVLPGDVVKVYLVDELNNSEDQNPVILQ